MPTRQHHMLHAGRWLTTAALLAALGLSACGRSSEFNSEAASDEGPAKVEPIKGTDVARVVLTPRAAQRLGIRTAAVRVEGRGSARRAVIPYAAVLYDAGGAAFTYTNPRRLVYVRRRITVDRVTGDRAVLSAGPRAGTAVVTVGAAELLGTEYGVEE